MARPSTYDPVQVLRRCSLFEALDDDGCAELASRSMRRPFTRGETIFLTGDPGDSLLGIVAGSIRITRTTADGDRMILADMRQGDVLGEIAVLDGRGRSADATALTNGELIVLSRRDVIPFLEERPQLCLRLLETICGKLRKADERSADLAFLNLAARLAKALLDRRGPPAGDAAHQGKVSLSQTELAQVTGATRPNVNRQLAKWQRSGIVAVDKGWIVLLDLPRLEAEAGTNSGR